LKIFQTNKWPNLDFSEDTFEEESKTESVKYIGKIGYGIEKLDIVKTTEEGIFKKEEYDFNPIIFYRVARPLKVLEKLPYLQGRRYFKYIGDKGFSLKIKVDFKMGISNTLININKPAYEKIKNGLIKFNAKNDEKLLERLNKYISSQNIDAITNPNFEINSKY